MWIFGFALMQIVVFGVVLYFYKKITAGDTEDTVKRLGAVYEDLLRKQKDLAEKLESAEKEYQAKKEESSLVADKLASQAMDEVRKKEEEILKKARTEAEDILSKAHASREQYIKELEAAASSRVVDFTADLLKNVFDEEAKIILHGHFIKNFVNQAKKSDLASVDFQDQNPVIRTAFALKKEEKDSLLKVLSERLGVSNLQTEEVVEEKLIAGIALQVGTLILDASFANAIDESARQVKEKSHAN